MSTRLRHRTVAVAVIYDPASDRYLLYHNKRWHGYAFPMKHFDPAGEASPAEVALAAIEDRDLPLSLPDATASPLDRHGECEFSEGVCQYTYYDYHVFDIDAGQAAIPASLDPDLRWFTYSQLQDAVNVTQSTKSIAKSLVEERKVAVALISRLGPRGREFLLVWNKTYHYFFPATRMKTGTQPTQAVVQAVRIDLAYDGPIQVLNQAEVPDLQHSQRFGLHAGRFDFYLCLTDLPGVDLTAPGNALETSLNALQTALAGQGFPVLRQPYWQWLTADELRTHPDMSPSVKSVIATVLQLAE